MASFRLEQRLAALRPHVSSEVALLVLLVDKYEYYLEALPGIASENIPHY